MLQPLHEAEIQLRWEFDQKHGGFGNAPKFPHPTSMDYLLHSHGVVDTSAAETVSGKAAPNERNLVMAATFDFWKDGQWWDI